jgi:Dockerin type I domain/PEP-CTERM motif
MYYKHRQLFLAVVAALAVQAATARAVILTPASDANDVWVRQSMPTTIYQTDRMWVGAGPYVDGGMERRGVVQWDLSSIAVPITSAYIQLYNSNGTPIQKGAITLKPVAYVNSAVFPLDVATLIWNQYASSIEPSETSFTSLGTGALGNGVGARQGTYQTLGAASASDLAALNAIRTGDGKITVIFESASGAHEFGDIGHSEPARLYINETPPEIDNLTLRVDRGSGAATIINPSPGTGYNINGYSITSNAGALTPGGWTSIHDGGDANWDKLGNDANNLAELNLSNSTTMAAGASISLGNVFTPFGSEALTFEYSLPDGTYAAKANIQFVGGLEVHVNRLIGSGGTPESTKLVIANASSVPIAINGYDISSAAGSLDPANSHGLHDKGEAGWDEVGTTANSLAELNLNGSYSVPANGAITLGDGFTTDAVKDLAFEYSVATLGHTNAGDVVYTDVLAGDANGDGTVNIFDINLISSNWNTAGPAGDANYDGAVNIFDVNYVSAHWNNTLPGGGSATAVPEPASYVLLSLGALAALARFPRRRNRRGTK